MPTTKSQLLNNLNTNFGLLKPVGIREFDYKASAIPGIIKLTLGEPDFNVPEVMKQQLIVLKTMILTMHQVADPFNYGKQSPNLWQIGMD